MSKSLEETAEVSDADLSPDLAQYLGYVVRRVFGYFSTRPDNTGGQARDYVVLAVLGSEDAASQHDLAQQLGINRTVMVKLIDRLEAAHLVTRARNPVNRRSYILSLTPTGRAALDDLRTLIAERDDQLTAALTRPERRQLNTLLHQLLPERDRLPDDPSTEFLVTQVHYELRRRGDGMLTGHGLRVRHFGPLLAIAQFGPCPQQQLARYLAITEPAAAQLVEELVRRTLVVRGQDPSDRRRYALTLTALGRERLTALQAAVDALQAQSQETLGTVEADRLRDLLLKLLPVPVRTGTLSPTG